MKLTEELKRKIDSYFEQVTVEHLYKVSSIKYGFQEDLSLEVKDKSFTHVNVNLYQKNTEYSIDTNSPTDPMPQAA
ncbi:hypothetical protein [Belliella aquatica]|uniref:Uncharacterized protein n=1 Tax=Belliella aquatica TaxID=1323734 RepID=A0ABQ1LXY4_9BACT|nr:hypothetical protein [Belliella aquatica]MCH7407287.1 hypothetical protein [Belliella aquatica]GGC31473.1 hypothetical protein GCM10010993_08040 [Belliella aquatica]